MIELHCHTTCSDGSLTPTQLVQAAAVAGVKALAISDHDTTQGWDEAIVAGDRYGVEIVPALELSTLWRGQSLHILGFYPDQARLHPFLQERIQGRIRRAYLIKERLTELGYPITLPETESIGRPHIAQALVSAGYVKTPQEAFDRFLHDHGPAYIPYEPLSAVEGVTLLRACGAVPVWAHPYLFRGDSLERTLRILVEAGLLGLEAFHPEHNKSVTKQLQHLAHRYHLLVTGGSDYHGPNGRNFLNMLKLDPNILTTLKTTHSQKCV
jgi:predicted metal-dependent phosphoesterase TrpH